ncbi:YeeE/YedE family protein [Acidihalobacter prosperus]|uniref:Membrane protein n=1 Tax=Acidihalobacter prosperus TaxID=160660 RepID=A0A1A6C6U2_9GAMM|nr:YeeE/YedE family protein [Acidihalobacter prosperus]OBS10278.1 membrane protein [Acidihalobacter prosperus]
MDLTTTQQVLLGGLGLAVVMGAVVNKTNFCTMGAVSDWVNMGDTGRIRAWMFAIAVAIAGVLILQWTGQANMSMVADNSKSFPPYLTSSLAWPRYLVGGFLFGVGMTLGSGCGNKTMVRIGAGNIKSLFVFAMMGVGAYLMMYTNFGYHVFLKWMTPAFIDVSSFGASNQGIGSILAAMFGIHSPQVVGYVVGVLLSLALIVWALRSSDFRGSRDNVIGGLIVGLIVVGGWWLTAGPVGQHWLSDIEFMDTPPAAPGAQSFTFVSPSGQVLYFLSAGFKSKLVTFGMMVALGVVLGSFLYALFTRKLRLEWFSSVTDFARHIVGGFLMGVGGVLGMGCTIGQGVTGVSTLALGSYMTLISIIFGSALTMKIEYYRMVYEGEATFFSALVAALADFHLVPGKLRKLEAV